MERTFWHGSMQLKLFLLANIKEHKKMAAINLGLRGDAATFAYTERVKNNGRDPIWEQFRLKFIEKYENHQVRGDLLRHKLRALRFYGPHRMTEYCEQYRHIESQIHDMAFLDRENQR